MSIDETQRDLPLRAEQELERDPRRELVGLSKKKFYRLRQAAEGFARDWETARQMAFDTLEYEEITPRSPQRIAGIGDDDRQGLVEEMTARSGNGRPPYWRQR